jgi:hypothetical protein
MLVTIITDSSAVSMVSQLLMRGPMGMYTCHVCLRTAVPRRRLDLQEDQARCEENHRIDTDPPIGGHC